MKLIGPATNAKNFEFKATWDGKNEPHIDIINGDFQSEGIDITSVENQKIVALTATKLAINEWIDAEIKRLNNA